jgi:hypothetical protein
LSYIEQIKIPHYDIKEEDIWAIDTSITHYRAFYYSYRSHKINSFDVRYDIKKGKCYLQGLHDDNDLVFNGKLKRYNGHVHFSFETEKGQNFFTITGYVVEKELHKRAVFRAMASTVSSNGFLMYFEIILIRQDHFNTQRELNLSRYLMLKRPTYRVFNQEIDHTSQLSVQKKHIDEISHMIGTYRVWYFGRSGRIYQSKFVINEIYAGFHYTGFFLEEDKNFNLALLRVTRVQGIKKLAITTHPSISIGIISQSIIEIPENKSDRLLEGAFCNIEGYASTLVLYKESDMILDEDDSFKIGRLEDDELKPILDSPLPYNTQSETYQKIYDRLKDLANRK